MTNYLENARVSSVAREEFSADKVEIFDHIMESRKMPFMPDLFGMMGHSPGALQAVASVGEHVRFHSALDEVLREMIICTVSQEVGNLYEWCHHIHRMPLLAQTARDIGAGGGIVFDNKQFHRVLM